MNDLLMLAAALLMGIAVAVAAWALRGWLGGRFVRDQAWMTETFLRFRPEPINGPVYVLAYYTGFLVWFVLLFALIPLWPVAVIICLFSLIVPRIFIGWMWNRRVRKIDAQIPQTIATLANSMRAGLTLVQAITRISEQAPEPIRMEFKIMANQYAYGADMETVIRNAKTRLNLANFTLFASALLLNREMGGDISETLTRISKSLDKIREMKKTVEAHTAEGRTNIKVLLVTPVIMLLLMALVYPKGVSMMFTTAPGWALLLVAAALAGAGVYFAARITRSEV